LISPACRFRIGPGPAARLDAHRRGRAKPVDQAIEYRPAIRVHINVCLHRTPILRQRTRTGALPAFDSPRESMEQALAAALHHWRFFAERYRAIPSSQLSFDLLNEPPWMTDQTPMWKSSRRSSGQSARRTRGA